MNILLRNSLLAFGTALIASTSFGQKKHETDAGLDRQKALIAFQKGDMESAKKLLISAKENIDKAAAHPDTENSQKTLWLKGDIYSSFVSVGMQAADLEFVKNIGEDGIDQATAALKRGYPLGRKYKSDIETTVDKNRVLFNQLAGALYGQEQFKEAAELYDGQAKFGDCISFLDTTAVFNSALCFEKSEQYEEAATRYADLSKINYRGTTCAVLASSAYRKAGKSDMAKAIVAEARKTAPTDRELLLESVNTNIEEGNAAGAEEALNEAIATDPNNKQLHYTIGTIYIDLKKNAEAEKALNKALEIDPNYADAQYQLGAHLVTWAGDLKTEANSLKFGDPNFDKLKDQSDQTYGRAIVPLENYIASYPEDAAVLNILFQLHRNLGNSEKAIEYKRKADALK